MAKFEIHEPIYFVSYSGNEIKLNKKYCDEINIEYGEYLIDGVWFTNESRLFKTPLEASMDAMTRMQFSLLEQVVFFIKEDLKS